uniref:PEP-CTERM protein-sorting domain-containing protein n=1 Tax=Solibacter usitatus (strain Ellin6076) TaxID=234267 RepID=Q01WQ1_SOLUE
MLKFLPARLFVIGVLATGAFASPVSYTITFTTTSGPAPTAGSFTYDSTTPLASRFSNFTVSWGSGLFDLTDTANTGEQFFGTDCGTTPSSASVFSFLSGQSVCANASVIAWDGIRSTGIQVFDFRNQELAGTGPPLAIVGIHASTPFAEGPDATGTFTISSPSAAPEPSTLFLTLLPAAFLLRRRITRSADPK